MKFKTIYLIVILIAVLGILLGGIIYPYNLIISSPAAIYLGLKYSQFKKQLSDETK